jgi:hypothetical protein
VSTGRKAKSREVEYIRKTVAHHVPIMFLIFK